MLPRFAQQLLRNTALPGVREIGPRRWPHVDVRVAVLAHDLASTAEDPHQQRALAATGGLFERVGAHLQHIRGKFKTDQVATDKQCVAIGLLVDVMAWHALARCARPIRRLRCLPWLLIGRTPVSNEPPRQPGRAGVAQSRPDNRFTTLTAASGRWGWSEPTHRASRLPNNHIKPRRARRASFHHSRRNATVGPEPKRPHWTCHRPCNTRETEFALPCVR